MVSSSRLVIVSLVLHLLSVTKLTCSWTPFGKIVAMTVEGPQKNETSHQQHRRFMEIALAQAKKARDKGEVPIGAIVVGRRSTDGESGELKVLARACNHVETNHDASAHAELLALRKAASKTKNWRLTNTTLYSTLEPCPMCLAAAQAFRVSRIVYGAPDLRLGAIKTHIQLLEVNHPYHNIAEVIPDVCAEESAEMLRSFFRERRKQTSKSPNKKDSSSSRGSRLRRFWSRMTKQKSNISNGQR